MAEMNWSSRLEHERLILSAPEVVYDHLSKLPPAGFWRPNIEEETVNALLDRGSSLIDLGVARFCSPIGPLEKLFERGGILRLAVLANQNTDRQFPAPLIYGAALNGSDQELGAIAGNAEVSGHILAALISNEMKDGRLDDKRWQLVVEAASKNPRTSTSRDDDDTFDDLTSSWDFNRPIEALWQLLKSAPATEGWAGTLWNALSLVPYPPSFMAGLDADQVISLLSVRWATPASDPEEIPINYAGLRETAARQLLLERSYDRRLADSLRNHQDDAFRKAFYTSADINGDFDIEACWQRDRAVFVESVILNKSLYRRANYKAQARIHDHLQTVINENSHLDHLHRTWRTMLRRMVEEDPEVYGRDPTPEMVRSEKERAESQERMAAWKAQNEQVTQAPATKPFSLIRLAYRWSWLLIVLAILLALWLDGRGH